ncbi:MAG: 2Fe-2S iron-sulfur cluster-binding protein [Holophagaceae bacterium]|nr:2Fe-2S iron-sulfur cluster-binding protein [Holophagaceae bacterium]
MPTLTINGQSVSVEQGTLLIDACRVAGIDIPHFCYHPCLKVVATCRMCLVEVKGQPKLVTSCSTTVADGMEVLTDSKAVAQARAGIVEFLSINHPLDCPVCDKAGECKLQDYAYQYGSGDDRMIDAKRRYGYEDLGAKIVVDKNRCIHCTRCVRFTREITGGGELTTTYRGSHLEVTTFEGVTLDSNPFAGNVVELCPVGALTSRDFRFKKRTWYLKPIPTISRHGADAKTIWADVDNNQLWRFRARPDGNITPTRFISDEERFSWKRYCIDPSTRQTSPVLGKKNASLVDICKALHSCNSVAVVAQGTFGCDALQQIGELATSESLRYASGNKRFQIQNSAIQKSEDGVINRAGALARGYRFDALKELFSKVESKEVTAVVIYHDSEFSDESECNLLKQIVEKAPFSLLLEPIPSDLANIATATLPVTTYLEESDFIVDHQGNIKRYLKALEPPKGIKTPASWIRELSAVSATSEAG